MKKKLALIILVLLCLPALLFIYNPSIQLGGFGLLLGVIGMTLSPVLLFGVLGVFVWERWK